MLTSDNNQDNLGSAKQYLFHKHKRALFEKLMELVNFMSNKTDTDPKELEIEDDLSESEIADILEDEKKKPWHCYHCGHSMRTQDWTNPEPPEKCRKCGRSDYKKIKYLGKHDPKCPRCRHKLRKLKEEVADVPGLS